MESIIDELYRLDLIQHHLEEVEDKPGKKVFFCPLCQSDRPKNKYTQKKGAMFWRWLSGKISPFGGYSGRLLED